MKLQHCRFSARSDDLSLDPYRLRRALDLTVRQTVHNEWLVVGGLEPHVIRRRGDSWICDCQDFAKGFACKHQFAVRRLIGDSEVTAGDRAHRDHEPNGRTRPACTVVSFSKRQTMREEIRTLSTRSGVIRFPTYIPVTTFGGKYPLDVLLQPYLPRLSQAVMVSYHYAKQMKQRPRVPLFIDSGGFAALFDGSEVFEQSGLGHLRVLTGDEAEVLTPRDVLEFQEEHADVAFTLDFPIPPKLEKSEAERRQALTIANAVWAIQNRRRHDLRLFACVQAWDVESASRCAAELARHPFDGFAIGGLVPRARDLELVLAIVAAVHEQIGDRPLHVFGLGKPETTETPVRARRRFRGFLSLCEARRRRSILERSRLRVD